MSEDASWRSLVKKADVMPAPAASFLNWIQKICFKGVARLGKVRGERRMELLETLQLGGKRQLLLVTCEGQSYLVGAGGDSVHSIVAIPGSLPQAPLEMATPNARLEMGRLN